MSEAGKGDFTEDRRAATRDDVCCVVNGLDTLFGERYVRGELRNYRSSGLGPRAVLVVEFLRTIGLEGRTILEVGSGIGALHLELLKSGAASATGVDAAPANIAASRGLAVELGLSDRVAYELGDFTAIESQVSAADVVLMDRVLCCYPYLEALLGAAADHTTSYCALTYPRRTWWMQMGRRVLNAVEMARRHPYRLFLHSHREIEHVLTARGLTRVYRDRAGVWEVEVWGRELT